jgi:zinc transport system substrate-binding protein
MALGALALLPGLAAAAPRVAVDIAPVHSVAARVMAGIGAPELIVPPGTSEHDYSLRPSEAALLQGADLVIWIGPDLTPWLAKPIGALAPGAVQLTLEDVPGVVLLPVRADGPFEAHEHEDAGHEDEDHAHPGGEEEHGHAGGHDGHLWLDPANAVAAAHAIAAALGAADPANAAAYAGNADAFAGEMAELAQELTGELAPLRGKRFLVFHDAYQYFEHRFAIPAAGSIALQDATTPGAARVAAIRERVRDEEIVCAFTEPQFEPKLLATVIEGTDVRTGVLDPIGAGLAPGADLYPALLRRLADGLGDCLGG